MELESPAKAFAWLIPVSLVSAFGSVAFLLRAFVFASAGGDLKPGENFLWLLSLIACPSSTAAAGYLYLRKYNDLGLAAKFLVPIGMIPGSLTVVSGIYLAWKSWL